MVNKVWETFGVQRITSNKHPGAVFFKVRGTRDDFVAKFYPGHEREAAAYEQWANTVGVLNANETKERQDGLP